MIGHTATRVTAPCVVNPYEFFETPNAYIDYLFRTVSIAGRVFEPCVGAGAIVRRQQEHHRCATRCTGPIAWCTNDLDPRHQADAHLDAGERACWSAAGPIDWTVTNPAFSPALRIIALALEHSRIGVAMHLRASIHEVLKTGPRRTFMRRYPPTGILWLPRFAYQRSPTTGRWTTDSVCACWVVWLHDLAAPRFIDYAPEWVIDQLTRETPAYRTRMDDLMRQLTARTAEVCA